MATTWLTSGEAVELSGFNPQYLRTLIREGKIKGRRFGAVWQVHRQSLLSYVRQADKAKAQDKRHGAREHKT
jgi:hypothetical protein